MTQIIQKIDQIIEERSLLKHPFYEMWSDGKLEFDSLAGYSKEYFQLVKQVPKFMEPLIDLAPDEMKDELIFNMNEETSHIELWRKFAGEMHISREELSNYQGLEKTNDAVSGLSVLMNSFNLGACAMYAFEKEIPKISEIKLQGLKEFYGLDSKNATEYFEQHMEADIRHSASWKKIIERSSENEEKIIQTVTKSISAQNLLLDSCLEAYC